ncbi:MAG TPA: hypothetical protein VHV51_06265 [Polyangiaceae bacterium]|jgi:hypothetical protein|nr:hypothetical protein [Polyangiaceae bacterium]
MSYSDENAFGVLIGYHALEADEYTLEAQDFAARFSQFRAAVRGCIEAFPLAESVLVREFGHALYLEFADGDQIEDPIGWIKLVRARLTGIEFASVGVLSHGGRWLAEEREALPSVAGVEWQPVSLPSEPLRRALYAETATHSADENDHSGWGPGIYVDTEAIEALGRTLKNAPTPLAVAGATFYRVAR